MGNASTKRRDLVLVGIALVLLLVCLLVPAGTSAHDRAMSIPAEQVPNETLHYLLDWADR